MNYRISDYPVADLIMNRWSPRAMSGENISQEILLCLFEAARWAPSSFNNQPWRFVYAHRGTQVWDKLFNLLVPFNQKWAQHAAVLLVLISRDTFEKTGKPSRTSSLDTGSAWENMALQGTAMNLVVHAMEGFSYKKARHTLNVPEGYTVEAMIAIGKPAPATILPKELQERENLSYRKPVIDFIAEGTFSFDE